MRFHGRTKSEVANKATGTSAMTTTKRHITIPAYTMILLFIMIISIAPYASSSLSSSSSGPSSNKHIPLLGNRKETKENGNAEKKSPQTNPKLSKHRFKLTGYGSKSAHRSIFHGKKSIPPLTNDTTLWVRQSDDGSTLWLKSSKQHMHQRGDFSNLPDGEVVNTTVSVSVTSDGNFEVTNVEEDDEERWIPIEGIYGFFKVPSGFIWVLITSSSKVYSAPLTKNSDNWWQIRLVTGMEMVHLPTTDRREFPVSMSKQQAREEARQLRLLRYAIKDHNFYFASSSSTKSNSTNCEKQVITDMTKNMQRSFLDNTLRDNQTEAETSYWWDENNTRQKPDSRFFWNEPCVQPLVDMLRIKGSDSIPSTNSSVSASHSALSVLLQQVIPVTSAFVGVQTNVTFLRDESLSTTSLKYDEILISRRSRFRAGTRFTKRGADGTGAVANYAETEQICLLYETKGSDGGVQQRGNTERILSHVQTRGSIPLRWSSPADIVTYRPRVMIGTDPLAQARAVRSHLVEQLSLYTKSDSLPMKNPQLVFINLIDKKSDQGRLGRAFDAVLEAVMEVHAQPVGDNTHKKPSLSSYQDDGTTDKTTEMQRQTKWTLDPSKIQHVWFDFHAECKGGRWDRLENLLNDAKSTLDEQGYFCCVPDESQKKWTILNLQRGVVRTNCMDCLDRTNVVQSIFGRYMLFRQLYEQYRIGKARSSLSKEATSATKKQKMLPLEYSTAFRHNPMSLPWSNGEVSHRLLWADNADSIALLYAGTPALKGDFTRTGKRTKKGALDDGMNSVQRHYLNNFIDADRQEGVDLMVGYADFATVDDDRQSASSSEYIAAKDRKVMTLQEAARAMLLGAGEEASDEKDNDGNHARIKKQKNERQTLKYLRDLGVGGALPVYPRKRGRRLLNLRWLPGDLQTHMRSQAAVVGGEEDALEYESDESSSSFFSKRRFSTTDALGAIDRRSHTDQPWWALNDSSLDDGEFKEKGIDYGKILGTASSTPWYAILSVVAVLKAPVTTAVAIICILFPSALLDTKEKDKK